MNLMGGAAALAVMGVACAPKPTPPAGAGFVEAHVDAPPTAERAAVLAVLSGANAASCYDAALARNPNAYGEVVVRFSLDAAGVVTDSVPSLATLGDDEAARCVADLVRTLHFAPPSHAGLKVVYPFVFTSNATPPEAARALKLRYGLIVEDLDADLTDARKKPPAGVVISW